MPKLRHAFGTLRTTGKLSSGEAASAAAAAADSSAVYRQAAWDTFMDVTRPVRSFLNYEVKLKLPAVLAGGYSMVALMQAWFGTQDDPRYPVFEGKFITDKNVDAVKDFYQAEELLHIIAVFPVFFDLFMNKVDFDTAEMTEDTALLKHEEAPGTAGPSAEVHLNVKMIGMEVSFEIIEQCEEIDGEEVLTHFCRHERFIDWVPLLNEWGRKILLWDQTWKFEMNRLEDGRYEVKHECTKFQGPFPIRLIIWLHQRYVVWACERFINKTDFGIEDADTDKLQGIMANIPKQVVTEFIGTVTDEKRKSIEALRNDPLTDDQELEAAEAEYEILKSWRYDPISGSMKMVKKKVVVPGSKTGMGPAFKVSDKGSKDAMAVAMKEAKSNKKVKKAMQEMTESPSLEFVAAEPVAKVQAEPVAEAEPKADEPVLEFAPDTTAKEAKDELEFAAKELKADAPKAEAASEVVEVTA